MPDTPLDIATMRADHAAAQDEITNGTMLVDWRAMFSAAHADRAALLAAYDLTERSLEDAEDEVTRLRAALDPLGITAAAARTLVQGIHDMCYDALSWSLRHEEAVELVEAALLRARLEGRTP